LGINGPKKKLEEKTYLSLFFCRLGFEVRLAKQMLYHFELCLLPFSLFSLLFDIVLTLLPGTAILPSPPVQLGL
jgi:hypothetical protein